MTKRTMRSADLQLGPPFEIIIAPDGGPRTKPKALNAALPFVRGAFVAVFDAEDRPEPRPAPAGTGAFDRPASASPACRRGSPSTTPPIAG